MKDAAPLVPFQLRGARQAPGESANCELVHMRRLGRRGRRRVNSCCCPAMLSRQCHGHILANEGHRLALFLGTLQYVHGPAAPSGGRADCCLTMLTTARRRGSGLHLMPAALDDPMIELNIAVSIVSGRKKQRQHSNEIKEGDLDARLNGEIYNRQ